MKRYGWVIGVKEEKIDEYKKLHAAVWPEILKMITECHFTNYSIYLRKMLLQVVQGLPPGRQERLDTFYCPRCHHRSGQAP